MNERLNVKQWLISWLVVFVFMTIVAYIPIKLEMAPWVAGAGAPPAQWDEMTKRIVIYLSRFLTAGLFTYIYVKASDGKSGIAHGLRYGFGISLIMYIPRMSAFAVSDWPLSAFLARTLIGIVEATICGAIVALLYKPAATATTKAA